MLLHNWKNGTASGSRDGGNTIVSPNDLKDVMIRVKGKENISSKTALARFLLASPHCAAACLSASGIFPHII